MERFGVKPMHSCPSRWMGKQNHLHAYNCYLPPIVESYDVKIWGVVRSLGRVPIEE